MASEAQIASASIAAQMELSRLESAVTAGEPVDFADLDRLVAGFKELSLPAPEPASVPINPDPIPA